MALMKAMVNSPRLSGTGFCSEGMSVGIVMKAMRVVVQVKEVYGKGLSVSMEKGLGGCDVILMRYI
jgi:hypothetical protein